MKTYLSTFCYCHSSAQMLYISICPFSFEFDHGEQRSTAIRYKPLFCMLNYIWWPFAQDVDVCVCACTAFIHNIILTRTHKRLLCARPFMVFVLLCKRVRLSKRIWSYDANTNGALAHDRYIVARKIRDVGFRAGKLFRCSRVPSHDCTSVCNNDTFWVKWGVACVDPGGL